VICCVEIQNECSESFETRQGAESYRTTNKPKGNRHNLKQRNTTTRINVDDINIVGRSQSAVRNASLALEGEAAKVGLKINEQKTKYMIAARNDRTFRDMGHSELARNTLKSSKNLCT
jgi:hypothetical protein